jgi:hypothetical protein
VARPSSRWSGSTSAITARHNCACQRCSGVSASARRPHHRHGATGRALRPVVQPVGAVDLILVEQVGQPFGQLQAPLGRAIGQKMPRGANTGSASKPGSKRIKRQVSGPLSKAEMVGTCSCPSMPR